MAVTLARVILAITISVAIVGAPIVILIATGVASAPVFLPSTTSFVSARSEAIVKAPLVASAFSAAILEPSLVRTFFVKVYIGPLFITPSLPPLLSTQNSKGLGIGKIAANLESEIQSFSELCRNRYCSHAVRPARVRM
jgi:hypothetical protein